MADFMETVLTRRSIRKFHDRMVPGELLAEVVEAARWAPSWGNSQCWELVVVKNRSIREQLHGAVGERNPGRPAVLNAPMVIGVCGKVRTAGYYKGEPSTVFGDWILHDTGLMTAHLCLAAHSLGLGTVIIGMFDHHRAREILDLPSEYEVVSLIPMGYPDQNPKPPRRREVTEFTHYDRFGEKMRTEG